MRIDHLAAHLFKIQSDFLDEYNHAVDNEGRKFTLKAEASKTAVKVEVKHANLKVSDMMQEAKERFKEQRRDYFVDGTENSLEIELAELVQQLNLIHYLGPFKSWFVGHPYNTTQVHQVIIDKGISIASLLKNPLLNQ